LAIPGSLGTAPISSAVTAKPSVIVTPMADFAKGNSTPPQSPKRAVIQVHDERSIAAHSLGIASVILGCLTLVLSLIPCVGMLSLPLSALGLLLAIIGAGVCFVRKGRGIGFPIAGAAINSLAFVIAAFWALLAAGISSSVDKSATVNQIAEKRDDPTPQISEPLTKEPANESDPPKSVKASDKDKKQDDAPIVKAPEEKEPKKKSPPVDSSDIEWPDASKSAVRQGDLRVKVTSVRIGIVELTPQGVLKRISCTSI
jgi:hypothetical protein